MKISLLSNSEKKIIFTKLKKNSLDMNLEYPKPYYLIRTFIQSIPIFISFY